jgi:hypothetical protein
MQEGDVTDSETLDRYLNNVQRTANLILGLYQTINRYNKRPRVKRLDYSKQHEESSSERLQERFVFCNELISITVVYMGSPDLFASEMRKYNVAYMHITGPRQPADRRSKQSRLLSRLFRLFKRKNGLNERHYAMITVPSSKLQYVLNEMKGKVAIVST